jgi:hypothetical protein
VFWTYRTVLQVRNRIEIKLLKKWAHRVPCEPMPFLFVYIIFTDTLSFILSNNAFHKLRLMFCYE